MKPKITVTKPLPKKNNAGLHLLYVKWAVRHLALIDECIKKLGDQSNINLYDMISAMVIERDKLITTNEAYRDAKEILDSIKEFTTDPDE